jgi:tetratricopeptide (TPR) repeat protein
MTAIQLLTQTHPSQIIKDEHDNIIWNNNLNISQFLKDILNKMVKDDFQERYQSVGEILKAIRANNNLQEINKNSATIPELKLSSTTTIPRENKNNTARTKVNKNKPWYLPLILISLGIIASEIIYPWLRPWYYLQRGNKLLDKNEVQASLSKFQKAIDLQRNKASAWKGRGDALYTLGRYSGALEAYQKAIAINPNNLKTLNNQGRTFYKLGEFQQAINTYQKVIEKDSNNAEAWSDRGLAYMTMQQYKPALESFERSQQIKPDEPTIWLQKV